MFCPNCGKEVKNDAVFCSNCGAKLNREVNVEKGFAVSAGNFKKKVGDYTKKLFFIIPIFLVAIVMIMFFSRNKKTTVNLKDYYQMTLSGYDGSGCLRAEFDADKFEKDYKDKFVLDEKAAKKWLKEGEENLDDDEVQRSLEYLKNEDAVMFISNILENKILEETYYDKLSNNDKIAFEYDEESITDLQTIYNCKIKLLKDYKVKGLEEVKEYDPFTDLSVSFYGAEGYGCTRIVNPNDEVGRQLTYGVSDDNVWSDGYLSNGNSVEIDIEDDAEDILEDYGVKLTRTSNQYEVEGLEALKEYDPFADITVTFEGTEPNGSAKVIKAKDEVGRELEYSVSNDGNLSNGDIVTIQVESDADWLEREKGMKFTRTSYETEVSGLNGYLRSAEEIPDECLEKMKVEAEKCINESIEGMGGMLLRNAEYIGNYFLTENQNDTDEMDYFWGGSESKNKIYLCFRVDVENYLERDEVLYDEVHTYYVYCRFTDLMENKDGQVTLDYSAGTLPDNTYEVTEPETSVYWRYLGYQDIDTMYTDCVMSQSENYNAENNVEDVETSYEPIWLTKIPETAKEYNGHYYENINVSVTWEEAKARCEKKGGHLATITSAEENAWVVKYINPSDSNYCWLGGEREAGTDKWSWITGEPWEYENFAEGQPDFYDSAEYYLCTVNPADSWNDSDMNGTCVGFDYRIQGYIIEWDSAQQQAE